MPVLSWLLMFACAGAVVLHVWLAARIDPADEAPGPTIHAWTHTPSALAQQILLGVCVAVLIVVAMLTQGFTHADGWKQALYIVAVALSIVALTPVAVALVLLGLVIAVSMIAPAIAVAVLLSTLKRR